MLLISFLQTTLSKYDGSAARSLRIRDNWCLTIQVTCRISLEIFDLPTAPRLGEMPELVWAQVPMISARDLLGICPHPARQVLDCRLRCFGGTSSFSVPSISSRKLQAQVTHPIQLQFLVCQKMKPAFFMVRCMLFVHFEYAACTLKKKKKTARVHTEYGHARGPGWFGKFPTHKVWWNQI